MEADAPQPQLGAAGAAQPQLGAAGAAQPQLGAGAAQPQLGAGAAHPQLGAGAGQHGAGAGSQHDAAAPPHLLAILALILAIKPPPLHPASFFACNLAKRPCRPPQSADATDPKLTAKAAKASDANRTVFIKIFLSRN